MRLFHPFPTLPRSQPGTRPGDGPAVLIRQIPGSRFLLCLSCLCLLNALPAIPLLRAEEDALLPFDPERIRRLSLDGVPRSLSIRQGDSVWLGYDLERAVVMKIWQAPEGKPGHLVSDFTTRSSGETLHGGAGEGERWRWRHDGQFVDPAIRYLGCSQEDGYFILSWELRHGNDTLTLRERVNFRSEQGKVIRQLSVAGLTEGEELQAPGLGPRWNPDTTTLTGAGWHRFVLQP